MWLLNLFGGEIKKRFKKNQTQNTINDTWDETPWENSQQL